MDGKEFKENSMEDLLFFLLKILSSVKYTLRPLILR